MSSDESTIPSKICSKCLQEFPATTDFFYKHRTCHYGLMTWCQQCFKAYGAKYRIQHQEEDRIRHARYQKNNREKSRAAGRKYYYAHREKERARKLRYNRANAEKVNAYNRQYTQAHPEKRRTVKGRYWRQNNPEKVSAIHMRRRAHKANAPINDFTAAQWQEMQEAYNHRCAYCGKRRKGKLTRDHITPLSKGGSHTVHNIIPACRVCNSSKGTRAILSPVQPLLFCAK